MCVACKWERSFLRLWRPHHLRFFRFGFPGADAFTGGPIGHVCQETRETDSLLNKPTTDVAQTI